MAGLKAGIILGAVLAGGESRRMGRPKEGVLLPGGRPMIEPLLDAMREAFGAVIVAGACAGYDCAGRPGVLHVRDGQPGLGPLGGLEALLASGAAEGYVVAACDQPMVTAVLLRRLAEEAGPRGRFFRAARSGEHLDPLPGYFPSCWLTSVTTALAEGRRSLRALVRSAGVEWVPLEDSDAGKLASINAPEDLRLLPEGSGVRP